jgi:hypothetical protein
MEEALANISSYNAIGAPLSCGILGFGLEMTENLTRDAEKEKERCFDLFERFFECFKELAQYPDGRPAIPGEDPAEYLKRTACVYDVGVLWGMRTIMPRQEEREEWLPLLEFVYQTLRKVKESSAEKKSIEESIKILQKFLDLLESRMASIKREAEMSLRSLAP